MPDKKIGLGSAVLLGDGESPEVFTAQGLTRQITPPPRVRAGVDGTVLGDTLETELPGIEEQSMVEFTQLWHPNHANHNLVDALFDSRAESNWRIAYGPAATAITATFPAQVFAIEPDTVEVNGAIARTVRLQRTGAIVWADPVATTTTTAG
jgi:hypothetical protein